MNQVDVEIEVDRAGDDCRIKVTFDHDASGFELADWDWIDETQDGCDVNLSADELKWAEDKARFKVFTEPQLGEAYQVAIDKVDQDHGR